MDMRNAWIAGCLVALGGCASSSSGLEGLDAASLPTSDDYDFDTVYLELNDRVTFQEGSTGPVAVSELHWREVILRPEGRDAANFSWSYTREFSDLLALDITVVRPDGETATFGLDDMSDQPISAMARYYDDARVVTFDAPEYPVGTVIDTRVRELSKRPDLFAFRHSFGRAVPVLQSRFEVRHPVDWEVLHRGAKAWKPIGPPPIRWTVVGAYAAALSSNSIGLR